MREITLSDGNIVVLDDEDGDRFISYRDIDDAAVHTTLVVDRCPCCGGVTKSIRLPLERALVGLSAGDDRVVIHKNRNRFDFRKENLQVITRQQELMRHGIQKNNQSGYKGVYWYGRYNKWRAMIGYNEKRIHIGYFTSLHDAAVAYNKRAIELFGKFAEINQVDAYQP